MINVDGLTDFNDEEIQEAYDQALAKGLIDIVDSLESQRSNDDYIVNKLQMTHYLNLLEIIQNQIDEFGGEFEVEPLQPKSTVGHITAYLNYVDLFASGVHKFCDEFKYCGALTIEPTSNNMICISLTMPNLFIKKGSNE